MKRGCVTLGIALLACLGAWQVSSPNAQQAELGYRSVPLLTVEGLTFKDLDRNGKLDPYEDWRLTPEMRAADLAGRLSLEELAGLMVHGTLPAAQSELGSLGRGKGYDLAKTKQIIQDKHVNSFITRLSTDTENFAHQNNEVQAIAESPRWGIPVTISSDPRNHLQDVLGASTRDSAFSMWPLPLGFAALNDPKLTEHFADVVRQEYLAVGIRESLSPQADLATEPRWASIDGTFGEDADIAKKLVNAYVVGMQHGSSGLNSGSVAAVVKHWVGYGAAKESWDGHNYYGRYAAVSAPNFEQHVLPFIGAFDAHVSAVMPTYSILEGLVLDGQPVEQVGAGFNSQLLGRLRQKYGFRGLVLSDWAITNPCMENCRNGAPAGMKPLPKDIGMPWGVENLTTAERFAKAINAGVDQIGGSEQSEIIVENVRSGAISEARVREAAIKILMQKFEQGLFEQPYVEEARAPLAVGNANFVREGETAQAKSVVLLQNKKNAATGRPLLPVTAKGKKIYLFGVDAKVAEAAGFQVVTQPGDADFAVIRAPAAYESEHSNYFFGSRQHEGRLWYTEKDPAYAELLRVSAAVPTVYVTMLDRPLVLRNVVSRSTTLLGTFGIADEPLMRLITGQVAPRGHLPFELPSSREAVEQQKADLPHDSKNPLFAFGFGLTYE